MANQYTAKCAGYHDNNALIVAEHEFLADHKVLEGSHSICPQCAQLYLNQILRESNKNGDLENVVNAAGHWKQL